MHFLFNLFRIIPILFRINKFNNTNSAYHKQAKVLIDKFVSPFEIEKHKNVPSNAREKMQWYMAEHIFACEFFNEITYQTSTQKNQQAYLLSGTLSAIFDLLIDDLQVDKIERLIRPSQSFVPLNSLEESYYLLYQHFVSSLDEEIKERSIHYYELLIKAQIKSKKQLDPTTSAAEIDEICKEKCGINMVFLRMMVKGNISNIEEQAWFEAGALVQYCNDAQDLYKDLKNKISTFATVRPNLETIVDDLEQQKIITFQLLKKTSFTIHHQDLILFLLHTMEIGIVGKLHSYSRLCNFNFSFENFIKKEKQYIRKNTFTIHYVLFALPKILNYQLKKATTKTHFKPNTFTKK